MRHVFGLNYKKSGGGTWDNTELSKTNIVKSAAETWCDLFLIPNVQTLPAFT